MSGLNLEQLMYFVLLKCYPQYLNLKHFSSLSFTEFFSLSIIMGNVLPFQPSCDETLDRIFRFLCRKGYIGNLKKNLKALQREMEDLKAIHDVVKNKVAREEAQHRHRLKTVQVWLTRVDNIDTRVKDKLSTSHVQLQKMCLCGLCSKKVCSSYKYGKSVFLLLEEVKQLNLEGKFDEVTELTPRSEVVERPTRPTVGQEEMLEKAWNRLMEDGVGIMGLHGMGGVGKTTLFKKIHNKFAEIVGTGRFDVVIWVVVSQGIQMPKLQEDIAKELHLYGEGWTNESEIYKAAEIYRVLKGKRFVLMLDDIWEKVDLEAIGVPFPTKKNRCKIAFTTRSREVCGRMGDHEPMQVKCLEKDQAWELFKSKVGDNILRDLNIVELAKKVAEKCHGLPLALSVIGETMSSKTTVQEWENAFDVLTTSAAEFADMENQILPILKFSYDSLVDDHIKSCFLYCALFPEDYSIEKEDLIDLWICEGFMGEDQVLKRLVNKGYDVLGTLIRANLLTDVETGLIVNTYSVVMHDVIREMALWIASDLGKRKESFVVQAGTGLHKIPKVKDWGAVRRMSLMNNRIEKIKCKSKCYELTTLLLNDNELKNLSGEFIQSMQKLLVLDLSGNFSIDKLPEQISELTSLQYLDLSYTSIEQLPVSLRELKKLTHLNLTRTSLCSIRGISKLSSLRSLKLLNSKVDGDVSLVKELQSLEQLQVLTIGISTDSGLEEILGDQRLANCIDTLRLENCMIKPINLLLNVENLRGLIMRRVDVSEIDTNKKCRKSKRDSSDLHNPRFPNLSTVRILDCKGIKDLTWLVSASNLVVLQISNSEEVEEIVNKEEATKLTDIDTPFQKLQGLTLQGLPKLESIYWSPLPFPFLEWISIKGCPKLRKLPLNLTSGSRVKELSITMPRGEQETELEWEDEDTKNRFLPLISQGREV